MMTNLSFKFAFFNFVDLQRKPIVHTPEIFSQFSQLGLVPPNIPAEVAQVIDQLQVC